MSEFPFFSDQAICRHCELLGFYEVRSASKKDEKKTQLLHEPSILRMIFLKKSTKKWEIFFAKIGRFSQNIQLLKRKAETS